MGSQLESRSAVGKALTAYVIILLYVPVTAVSSYCRKMPMPFSVQSYVDKYESTHLRAPYWGGGRSVRSMTRDSSYEVEQARGPGREGENE